jgi:hypothetical protein
MPKVIKIPIRDQPQKPDGNATSELSSFHQAMVLPVRNKAEDSVDVVDMITRWINLADQALSSESSTRKRA